MSVYFRVVATDATPTFEAISQWMGVWSGIAKVDDEAEIARLRKLGKPELTPAEYEAERKKKASLRPSFHEFREVMGSGSPVQLAAKAAEVAAQQSPAPPAELPSVQVIAQPSPVPPRRKSVAT